MRSSFLRLFTSACKADSIKNHDSSLPKTLQADKILILAKFDNKVIQKDADPGPADCPSQCLGNTSMLVLVFLTL